MASFKKVGAGWRLLAFYSSDRCLLSTTVPCFTPVDWHHSVNTCRNCQKRKEFSKVSCRKFFKLTGVDKKIEYSQRKLVGYSMEQMYEVVSDVKSYTEFLPFCKRSDILYQQPSHFRAHLEIGFPPILESYTSHVTLSRPRLVKAESTDGKVFNSLLTLWRFSPGEKSSPQSCVTDFFVSFEFRTAFHAHVAHTFFNELVRQMEGAFLTEASRRFGKAAIKSQKLNAVVTARS